jgi:lysozyme
MVKGLDVSHYDGPINFEGVKRSGRDFVIAKCTEYNVDANFARNKTGAKAAGLIFGSYHFFHPLQDAAAQAQNFLNRAQLAKGDLIPTLDWEATASYPSSQDRLRAKLWLNIVEKAIGRAPIIYGSPYFLQSLTLEPLFSRYPLWIAYYGANSPLIPAPWHDWTFWQTTNKGSAPGIPAPDEDLDVFNGTYTDLKKLVL